MSALSFSVQEIIPQVEDANEASSSDPWGSQTIFSSSNARSNFLSNQYEIRVECIYLDFQTVFQSPGSTPARPLAPLPSMSNRSRFRSTNWIFSLVEQWRFTQSAMAIKLSYRRANAHHWSEIPNRSGGRKGHVVLPSNVMEDLHQYRFYSYPLQLNLWIRRK